MKLAFDPNRLDQRSPALIRALGEVVEHACVPWHRFEMRGLERYPEGPALVVGNHNGGLLSIDTFLIGNAIVRAHGLDALPYGMGHDRVVEWPPLNWVLVPLGAMRACPENAAAVFRAGGKVLVYPGGDIDTLRPFSQRHRVLFGGRVGYIRTALHNAIPIVPIVAGGAHATLVFVRDLPGLARLLHTKRLLRTSRWPLTLSIPWGVTFGPSPPYFPLPTPIIAEILEPMTFERTGPEAARDDVYVRSCADRVEAAMQSTLSRIGPEAEARWCRCS